MAEVGLDGFGIGAGSDEQAGAGVAQIVNTEALRETGLIHGRVPDLAPEAAVAQRSRVAWGVSSEVVGEEFTEELGDPDGAASVVLGGPVVELATSLGH